MRSVFLVIVDSESRDQSKISLHKEFHYTLYMYVWVSIRMRFELVFTISRVFTKKRSHYNSQLYMYELQ